MYYTQDGDLVLNQVGCPRCDGTGRHPSDEPFCEFCGGVGEVGQDVADDYRPRQHEKVKCPHCDGSGWTGRLTTVGCGVCDGKKVVSRHLAEAYGPPRPRARRSRRP